TVGIMTSFIYSGRQGALRWGGCTVPRALRALHQSETQQSCGILHAIIYDHEYYLFLNWSYKFTRDFWQRGKATFRSQTPVSILQKERTDHSSDEDVGEDCASLRRQILAGESGSLEKSPMSSVCVPLHLVTLQTLL
ncbi:mCG145116, partial [Mus musculus]